MGVIRQWGPDQIIISPKMFVFLKKYSIFMQGPLEVGPWVVAVILP